MAFSVGRLSLKAEVEDAACFSAVKPRSSYGCPSPGLGCLVGSCKVQREKQKKPAMGLPPLVWHVRTGHTLATLSRAYGTLENYCFAVSGTFAMWFHVVSLQRVLALFSKKTRIRMDYFGGQLDKGSPLNLYDKIDAALSFCGFSSSYIAFT